MWASIGCALPALMGAQLGAAGARRAVLFIGDVALTACDGDRLAFVELVLDRRDLPPLLERVARAIATQNG